MATTDNLQTLTVSLEARFTQFEKAMVKAQGVTNRRMREIENRFTSAGSKIGAALGKGLLGGIAALGGTAIAGKMLEVARAVAAVGDEAKRAGVGIEAFQELKFVADQSRIGIDALTDGMKELNLRADEFIVTGAGSGAEAFTRLGYNAETLADKLKKPEDLFTEIIGKLGELDQAAQIRIADEIFGGTGGEKFVQLIGLGAEGINAAREQARALGQVLSEDVVNKAGELDKAIKVAADSVGTALQGAIVEAGFALYDFMQQWWQLEDRTTGSLSGRLSQISTERARLEAEVARNRTGALDGLGLSPSIVGGTADYVSRTGLEDARKALAEIIRQEREINGILDARKPPKPADRGAGTGTGVTTGLPPADEIKGTASAIRDVAAATSTIEAPVNAANLAFEQMQANIQVAEGLAQSFAGSIVSDLMAGKDATEALGHAFSNLAEQLLQMALNQAITGVVSSLFGAIGGPAAGLGAGAIGRAVFGGGGGIFPGFPGFASGTSNTGGRRGDVRGLVHGQEAVIPLPNGGNVPVDLRIPSLPSAAPAAAGMSRVVIDLAPGLEARILQQAGQQTVQIVESNVPRMIDQRSPTAVAQANRNRVMR